MIQVGFTPTTMWIIPYNITINNNDYYINKLSNMKTLLINIVVGETAKAVDTHSIYYWATESIRLLMRSADWILYL